MKRIIVLMALLLCLFLTGCGAKMESVNDDGNRSMFVIVEKGKNYRIVYHRDTKVMYAISYRTYNSGNFTVLVDPRGKPLLYQEG